MAKIYTKSGDDGTTALGSGERISKNHARIRAYGAVDELNSTVGFARSHGLNAELDAILNQVQNQLFVLGADLSCPVNQEYKFTVPRINSSQIEWIEKSIDEIETHLPPLTNFILPAGSPAASALHLARTVCRRAEREVVALYHHETRENAHLHYLNRLSDLFFVMARRQNQLSGMQEISWKQNI